MGSFGVQVGGCGGLSWRSWSLFWVYVGSCRTQIGVWEVQTPQGRCLEKFGRAWVGSGAGGDLDLGPTWIQLEPSWTQLGSGMGPT